MVHYYTTDCQWLPANHFLFQLANICLVFSYLVPDTLNGLFLLRFWLGSGGLFFALWAWLILCAPDTLGWNLAFMILNYAHFLYLLIKIKRPRKFGIDCEQAYTHLFEPFGLQRYQFQVLADKALVLKLDAGEVYGKENAPAERISILLSGSVEVMKDDKILHITRPYEFLDAPEWAASLPGETAHFGVTLTVRESIHCLTWNSNELRKILKTDQFLKNIFDSLIGQDVTKKLLRISGNMAELHTQKNLDDYLTGSVVYLHKEVTNIRNSPQNKVCCTIVTEDAICVSTPITIHPSDEHEMMYLPDKDTSALLSNRSNSPQTPISTIGRHFKRTVNGVPSAWQESTPLVAPDCKSQDLERETVL